MSDKLLREMKVKERRESMCELKYDATSDFLYWNIIWYTSQSVGVTCSLLG